MGEGGGLRKGEPNSVEEERIGSGEFTWERDSAAAGPPRELESPLLGRQRILEC
jgi:hypothetical protein